MTFFDQEKWNQNKKGILILLLVLVFFVVLEKKFTLPQNKNLSTIIINEIMPSNKGAYADKEGNCYDWVELYNSGEEDISLKGYSLSDGNLKNEEVLGDITLKSHEYLLLYLTGKEMSDPYYLSFALNKTKEEPLILKNEQGQVLSTISIPNIKANQTYAYHHKKYAETSSITPGYSNTVPGRLEYLKDRREMNQDVLITEFLVDNEGLYQMDGELYPYIEITNFGETAISLGDYFLSDDKERPFQYRLPNKTLEPNTSYLIYPTKKDLEEHANFTLDKTSGEILLSKKNKVVESISYQVTTKGYAFVREENTFLETPEITPGFLNTLAGRKSFLKEDKNPNDLIINEVMPSNDTYAKEKNGKYYDWIELKNASDKTISLENYSLTTNLESPNRFSLPKKSLKKGETILIMASLETVKGAKYIHANFRLSENEGVFLFHGKELVDSLYIPPLKVGYSYGRGTSSGHYYYSSPTPNKKNNTGSLGITRTPTFSIKPGVYQDQKEIKVELLGEGDIYYTLDGSIPTKNSKKYKGAITLTKTSVIRAVATSKEKTSSEILTGSYIIGENHTLPVTSISLPKSQFQKLNASIHTTKLEYPAHVEFYEEKGSFSIDCGLKLFGGQSRELPKKSYALKFSSQYGTSSLSYPIFENREILNYNTLVLRSGSQDMEGSMFRDELADAIADLSGNLDTQAYKATVLYINGEYWGIYYFREKIDDVFIGEHYNVSPSKTNIVKIEGEVDEGTRTAFNKLMQYVKSHDLSIDKNYQEVSKMLDIDNYIEFTIAQFLANNIDIRNTRYFNHPDISSGKIRMIYYDLDYAFRYGPINYLTWVVNPEGAGYFNVDNSLIRGLMKNKSFQEYFLSIFFYDMKYVYTEEKLMKEYNRIYQAISPEMKRNQARWNYSYDTFLSHAKDIQSFLKGRREKMINNVKSYFQLSDKEVKNYLNDSHYLQDYMKRQSQIAKSSL